MGERGGHREDSGQIHHPRGLMSGAARRQVSSISYLPAEPMLQISGGAQQEGDRASFFGLFQTFLDLSEHPRGLNDEV